MSGRMSRNKGKRGELEACEVMQKVTNEQCQRSYHQARDGSDAPDIVVGNPPMPLWVEVKRGKRPSPVAALRQAQAALGNRKMIPIALTRADNEEWLVTLRATDLNGVCWYIVPKDPFGSKTGDD